ncbi:MAG: amidohydrolase [Lewinella sp.]|nr:amidohydrolase [Lewinella sp.]
MQKFTYLIVLGCLPLLTFGQGISPNKQAVITSIEAQSDELIRISDEIWALAETAFEESGSAELLANYAEAQGFRVERGVAEMPTAFIAEYGSGEPIIGIMGEFDALPGISQKAQPTKEPLNEGAAGHGCGHNLFGAGSLGAAVAIRQLIEAGELSGTIRFYGTPAEEKFFGKLFLARAGLFDDLDVCLDWHPSSRIEADVQSSLALVDFIVEFRGQAAHASSDPWNGRSAVDGLELFTTGINYQREHLQPTVRIHYQIQHGGDVVNVVPDYARIWVRVRDSKRDGMLSTYERVQEIARGAAIMANVDYEITLVSGLHEVLPNRTGGAAMHANLEYLGPIEYTEAETVFAHGIQEATDKPLEGLDGSVQPFKETRENPGGGSTDVGDVSWLVPEIRLRVTTAPTDTPWHSWAVVACGGMSIGHKGMIYAGKALAMTMVDLFENPELVKEVQAEFAERKGDAEYEAILPAGPPPIPAE